MKTARFLGNGAGHQTRCVTLQACQNEISSPSSSSLTPEHMEQVQRHMFQMTAPRLETSLDPLKLFGNNEERMKKMFVARRLRCQSDGGSTDTDWLTAMATQLAPQPTGNQYIIYVQDDKLKQQPFSRQCF
ncbi:hypothetical protein J1614_005952 [Plenodomus biglobosus]|nr:hypothetical protein J1614_005952 [Plenodomus biglobosus]